MKDIKIIYFVLMLGIFTSCSFVQNPDLWMVEIEDAYRAEALRLYAMYFSDFTDAELQECMSDVEHKAEQIEEEHMSDSNVAKYKMALEALAPTSTYFYLLNQAYNDIDVNLGKFVPCSDESGYAVFQTMERNTNIKVTFKINKTLDYLVLLDEEDVKRYLESEIARELMDIID